MAENVEEPGYPDGTYSYGHSSGFAPDSLFKGARKQGPPLSPQSDANLLNESEFQKFFRSLALADPCGPAPQFLERASPVALEPPVAEGVEDNDAADAEAEACGVAAMPVETESPVVEDQSSDHRLTEVIGKAHLAERRDPDKPFLRLGLVEKQGDSGYDHQHHTEILPHVQHYIQALGDTSGFHRFGEQIIEWKQENEAKKGENKNVLPDDKVVSFVVEQPFTSEKDSEEEKAHCLGHSAVFDSPEEVYGQSVTYSGSCNIED